MNWHCVLIAKTFNIDFEKAVLEKIEIVNKKLSKN